MKSILVYLSILLGGSWLVFTVFQRQFSHVMLNVVLDPKLQMALQASANDQKRMARVFPDEAKARRVRFDELQALIQHHNILELNRDEITERFEWSMIVLMFFLLTSAVLIFSWSGRRRDRRLRLLQGHLNALAGGQTDIVVDDRGGDTIGQIGRMIERTSSVIAGQRQRLQSLENLAAWQEGARRQAHEIRTPLMAARMALDHLVDTITRRSPDQAAEVAELRSDVDHELKRLKDFTHRFASFAKIGSPKLRTHDPNAVVARFCRLYRGAWGNVQLQYEPGADEWQLQLDEELVGQVLVNLCNNSSQAAGEQGMTICLEIHRIDAFVRIDVIDDGPGIPDGFGSKLFKPYATTKKVGQGMGLGLAISKKIMLDHGGDLVLVDSSPGGCRFSLIFPIQGDAHG